MSELDGYRQSIDEIDRKIVSLFEERMSVTQKVGEYKQKIGKPVLDRSREKQVLAGKTALVEDPKMKTAVTLLYETVMGISRRQQREIVREGVQEPNYARFKTAFDARRAPVENPRIIFQGEPGAYSEQAARNFFGKKANIHGVLQFENVFIALKEGWADYGVVPIENNSTGAISQV